MFSGGLPSDVTGVTPSITIMQGKSTTLLEMEYSVIDFLLVTDSPYGSDYQTPEAVIVMLNHDLVNEKKLKIYCTELLLTSFSYTCRWPLTARAPDIHASKTPMQWTLMSPR